MGRAADTSPAAPPARDPDFSEVATGELERARRDLAMSAALAVPGSGAWLMTVTHAQAIDAELAARRQEPAAVDGERPLEALRRDWGGAYAVCFDDAPGGGRPRWRAWPLGSSGTMVTGTTPGELDAAIRAHWQAGL
jgi:hypothetical protein